MSAYTPPPQGDGWTVLGALVLMAFLVLIGVLIAALT